MATPRLSLARLRPRLGGVVLDVDTERGRPLTMPPVILEAFDPAQWELPPSADS
ncbi:MAG: hypothetical protein JKY65_15295 [Planctomycetes bacterium]|nr:hypothetical protein [Planctomycetota bacterium]